MQLNDIEKQLHYYERLLSDSESKLGKLKNSLNEAEQEAQIISLATKILEAYLESVSKSVSGTLETLMQSALQVFNMGVQVRLDYTEGARGGYRPVITQDGVEGGLESFGGGVMSLISFIMLISTIVLKKKKRFIVLDESLKEVSAHYQEPLSRFIRQLCDDFEFTILLVSHQPELNTEASIHYEIGVNKSGTTITKR